MHADYQACVAEEASGKLLSYGRGIRAHILSQAKALDMQEQERIANEEAEKRLKAALTAKREPGASTSRVATPDDTAGAKPEFGEGGEGPSEDTAMEVDSATLQPTQPAEVRFSPLHRHIRLPYSLIESVASRAVRALRRSQKDCT
jgi:hypothetical protein